MSNVLVVLGATGNQGRAVLTYFQQHEPSYKLRGTSRNPSSDAAITLAKSGIEIVKADLNDLDSLKHAFQDATVIFAYTAGSEILQSSNLIPKVMSGELKPPVGQYAYEIEVQQGKNVADAAATIPTLHRLVWSSLTDVRGRSHGKYVQAYHLDSKYTVWQYMRNLPELKDKASAVLMGGFMDNLANTPQQWGISRVSCDSCSVCHSQGIDSVPAQQTNGDFLVSLPLQKDYPIPWVDVERDTGAFVHALTKASAGTHVLGVSEWLGTGKYLELLFDHLEVKGQFQDISFEAAVQDDPLGLKLQFAEGFRFAEEFGYTGGDPEVVSPDDLEKQGFSIPRSKIIDHIKRTDWSKFLGTKPAA
ncbi:hypothetical protein LTR86_007150 [Recurvomyces mirabilis]|nr:hypothetical protein LTR86_007150 [Recurvomyces mirabilis]